MKKINFISLVSVFFMIACQPEISEFSPDAGNADFSTYIALGGFQTAGFSNNELYKSGQMVSFPYIISRQLLYVGGGDFKQPLMRDELGFGNKLKLSYTIDCMGDSILMPVPEEEIPDEANAENIYAEEGPFHNLGVPGAKIRQFFDPVHSTTNPFSVYFSRFASSPATTLVLDAKSIEPRFFSLWIGTYDILEYAINGGQNHDIIEAQEFRELFSTLVFELTANNAKGIVANIPDITHFPFFSHLKPTDLWVEDLQADSGKRLLQQNELVLLSAEEKIKCEQWGTESLPLPEGLYLSSHQVGLIKERISSFNTIIKNIATEHTIAHADMHTLFNSTSGGLTLEGIFFNHEFISGGLFSLDGISLSRRGNAIIANAFIEAINLHCQSSIPLVSVTQFQGIVYP